MKADLWQIQLFHTDRGNEFKNKTIDEALDTFQDTFQINRSLSMKGCPYDNAVLSKQNLLKVNISKILTN